MTSLVALSLSLASVASGVGCPPPQAPGAAVPAPDLYCVPLYPAQGVAGAAGRALLLPAPTPFGVAVTRDGLPRLRIRLETEGLPEPEAMGPYQHLVAWLTPPTLLPTIKLGSLEAGVLEAVVDGFNQWLLLVSAEADPVPVERTGPLVLRGASPSMVLRPHDLAYVLTEMVAPREPDPSTGEHGGAREVGHAHGAPPLRDSDGAVEWTNPPMHPMVPMPHQMMALRPGVDPFLPPWGEGLLPGVRPRETVRLADGDTLLLEAAPVRRRIGRREVPGYGFNGQIPGPLLEAEAGSTVHVRFRNRTALPSAIHWHGIRLDAPFDGVPGITQDPVQPEEEFLYRVHLPDEGTFWYHPHLREDVAQDLGLAGNLRVRPRGPEELYAPVDREVFLLLDDHLTDAGGRTVPYGRQAPIHALMGRFGNVLLANGSDRWSQEVRAGEWVRFHLTNAANTRTFNLSFQDLPMRLVGGDVGRIPREAWVESVVIAPAERWVVEVRFPEAGEVALENRVQALDHMGARFFPEVRRVGTIHVAPGDGAGGRAPGGAASPLRTSLELAAEVDALVAEHGGRPPDRTLVLDLRTRDLPFPLNPLLAWEGAYRPPVEWAGTMPDMDWLATGLEVEWILRDPETGRENMEIGWRFPRGKHLRLRLVNERGSLHPMQHPVHLHGQRFLVLAVNGEAAAHPTWKDTVLVPVGAVVDLLVDLDNPGPWMLHCHIAEHLEAGMMTVLHVDP